MKFIKIVTACTGREYYLRNLVESINKNIGNNIIFHDIFINGFTMSDDTYRFINSYTKNSYTTTYFESKKQHTLGKVMNEVRYEKYENLVVKLDDDCRLISEDFFDTLVEVLSLMPDNIVLAPYPVGLINNPGGAPANGERFCLYSEKLDKYFTFRPVDHIGGFAKACLPELVKSFTFSDANMEDVEFSRFCNSKGVPMFYLENGLIVEHQESTLGQHERYGKEYFGDRF